MNLYTKQKWTQKHKKLWLPKGKERRGGIIWEYSINRYNLLLYKIDKQ